ncbi:M15 family metallopeptidase [Micrococcoides hystricis]|uniref:D-alanyl-D-alanine carboxypeptidase family protein n=1 Tax=Micrococcoides hystricis TaxID=1572761 RepID=A0ABV6P9W7_9MICC
MHRKIIAPLLAIGLTFGFLVGSTPADAQASTTKPSSVTVIVNKKNPLRPKTYRPSRLVSVGNSQALRPAAASAYKKMAAAARTKGHRLYPISGYRSYATQKSTYAYWVSKYGVSYANRISAKPGYSEHQLGLAIDIGDSRYGCALHRCFGSLSSGKWLAANAHRYGFILRYPAGKEWNTGYSYEPWHFRYVGVKTATKIKYSKKTMEQYFGYKSAPTY